MKVRKLIRCVVFAMTFSLISFPAAAEDFSKAVKAFLQDHIGANRKGVGIVIGIVDARGSRIISCGNSDNGAGRKLNGDTVFAIDSITKTFTTLLLEDMVERGEMMLNDPVSKYLPAPVKMPMLNGREITLLDLATHTSGLPRDADNLEPKLAADPYADYTPDELYAFLSSVQLTHEPGGHYEYSNIGAALLGYVIGLKAGTNYESLVVNRICRSLGMNSTRITLTPKLASRSTRGHNIFGERLMDYHNSPVLLAQGGLHSTANDLLKYVSANLGLTQSRLTPLMEQTHVTRVRGTPFGDIGLAWEKVKAGPEGTEIIWHTGGSLGYSSFVGFDKAQRRGVVVLSNYANSEAYNIGLVLLNSEWDSSKRPRIAKVSYRTYDSYVGQYQMSSNSFINVYCQGNRLMMKMPGNPFVAELLVASRTNFVTRVINTPVIFGQDIGGKTTRLTLLKNGTPVEAAKVSDTPAPLPEPVKERIPVKLDSKAYDSYTGRYEFATNATVTNADVFIVERNNDQLTGRFDGKGITHGAFGLFPASETNFFDQLNGAQYMFIRNGNGEVTGMVLRQTGRPDYNLKKLPDNPSR